MCFQVFFCVVQKHQISGNKLEWNLTAYTVTVNNKLYARTCEIGSQDSKKKDWKFESNF